MSARYTRGARSRRRQSNTKAYFAIAAFMIVGLGVYALNRCESASNQRPTITQNAGEILTVVAPDSVNDQIYIYRGMNIAFNSNLHIPNWVAWDLTADEVAGTEPRTNKFFTDPTVEGCAQLADYKGSGYDRGHMAPAGDMKWDAEAMKETFFLTNIAPQAPELNQKAWMNVEEKCRARVSLDSVLYIVCGPVPGEIREYIGDTRVAVPERFFKVICAPYANPPYAIGFIMENGRVAGGMQKAAVTVDRVEEITGYDFFSALDDDLENRIESNVNFDRWSRLK